MTETEFITINKIEKKRLSAIPILRIIILTRHNSFDYAILKKSSLTRIILVSKLIFIQCND